MVAVTVAVSPTVIVVAEVLAVMLATVTGSGRTVTRIDAD
jgi:hypothetical protein|tara:strand:- start:134 stop:253 length:120 start_codon:yes stop_codon:yes gene_type:complete